MSLPPRSRTQCWQFILADLALILFLLTLTGLPLDAAIEEGTVPAPKMRHDAVPEPSVAPAQALYRPASDGPSLTQWLASQPRDPRATLTIFVQHPAGGEQAAWVQARALAAEAGAIGVSVRIIMAGGEERDLYASLAYDAPVDAQR
jgi:uncharacterized iron-regulated membrane protein